jgi:hypothetical protein
MPGFPIDGKFLKHARRQGIVDSPRSYCVISPQNYSRCFRDFWNWKLEIKNFEGISPRAAVEFPFFREAAHALQFI